jgi:phospholipid-translocating ATPase
MMDSSQKIREIFLPPDVSAQKRILRELPKATRKAKKAFTEAHPWTVSNEVRSAKYTVLNFLPKNLFEQFRRVANVYFLILIILQAIPIFSNTNVFLAASPLVSILIITAIKDAMEDWKRQKSDRRVNHTISLVLKRGDAAPSLDDEDDEEAQEQRRNGQKIRRFFRSASAATLALMNRALFREKIAELTQDDEESEGRNAWQQKYWKDVRVGDILMIKNNESIPADLIVLATSDSQRICYVETKNLDGETNLKIRQAPNATAWIQTADQAASLNAVLQVEPPSTRLYTFSGKMVLPLVSQSASTINVDAEAVPLASDNLLLRGCQIRNTEYVIGLVAYTGEHSKIIMNSGKTPSKRSKIERQMNPQIILSFILLFVICMTCAIMQGFYVGGSIANAPYWYTLYKTGPMSSPIFTGFLTFW